MIGRLRWSDEFEVSAKRRMHFTQRTQSEPAQRTQKEIQVLCIDISRTNTGVAFKAAKSDWPIIDELYITYR